MRQAVVQFCTGTYEDASVATLTYFVDIEDDVTGEDIIALYIKALKEAKEKAYGYQSKFDIYTFFTEQFNKQNHEDGAFDIFEKYGFNYGPNETLPVTVWCNIQGLDRYLEDEEDEYNRYELDFVKLGE